MAIHEVFPMPANISNPVNMFIYVNEHLVDYTFGIFVLFAIFAIAFIAMRADGRAFIASMGITTVSAIFLATINLLDPNIIIFCAAVMGVSIFFLKEGQR